MVELNLLPWRVQHAIYNKKRQRLAIMLGVLLALSIWALMHHYLQAQIDIARDQLKTLQTRLSQLNAQQAQHSIQKKSGFYPHELAQFLSMLAEKTESGNCYQELSYENHALLLMGQSWSMTAILLGLQKMEIPEGFTSYVINKIDKKNNDAMLNYSVKFNENYYAEQN